MKNMIIKKKEILYNLKISTYPQSEGRAFVHLPNLICYKHFCLCQIIVDHNPDQIEVICEKCNKENEAE